MKKKQLFIDGIRTEKEIQTRWSLHEPTVIEYQEIKNLPPIVVFEDKTGDFWLADGFHRLEAARRNRVQNILAEVTSGTREDAIWYSCGANIE